MVGIKKVFGKGKSKEAKEAEEVEKVEDVEKVESIETSGEVEETREIEEGAEEDIEEGVEEEKEPEEAEGVETNEHYEQVEQQFEYCVNRLINLKECGKRAIEKGYPVNIVPDDVIALEAVVQVITNIDIPEDILFEIINEGVQKET